MLSINTNLPSIIAQNSLKQSTLKLNTAIERMTTGYKINGAKDNAANYSIATNMGVKLSSYQVAEDNCAMGLDLITTASESLDLINDKLVRLRALAEQSANGTYGEQSLKAINAEANALVDEIERTYKNTEYNGINLFGENEPHFIEEVVKRDTSLMTTLSSVDENTEISSGTYSISTAEELAKLATMTNNGKVKGGEFVLASDIDLSAYSTGEGWTPIGKYGREFACIFDGNGYVVSNLYINRPNNTEIGLFGDAANAEIKNLGVVNADVTGKYDVGGLVGYAELEKINNCFVTGNIVGTDFFVGGLIGFSRELDISNCYAIGQVESSASEGAGGLIGFFIDSEIVNCFANVNVTGKDFVGGLIGDCRAATINNCYSTGNVTGKDFVGGFLGYLEGGIIINNCYSMGSVIGQDYVGGFFGNCADDPTITNGYYNIETSGQNDTGKGEGVTSTELKALIENGTLWQVPQKENQQITTFQVGINSSINSQITLDTAFSIDVSSLRGIGRGSANYLNQIDIFINTVSAKQTEYGAVQNRLDSALDEISTRYDNLVSSRSTLRDADIAEVSSEYIRQQILQQASATLLSTANQTPALALQLL